MSEPCVYCGCDVHRHDPLYLEEGQGGERTTVGAFCNYGCLSAFINEEDLAIGTSCRFEPG